MAEMEPLYFNCDRRDTDKITLRDSNEGVRIRLEDGDDSALVILRDEGKIRRVAEWLTQYADSKFGPEDPEKAEEPEREDDTSDGPMPVSYMSMDQVTQDSFFQLEVLVWDGKDLEICGHRNGGEVFDFFVDPEKLPLLQKLIGKAMEIHQTKQLKTAIDAARDQARQIANPTPARQAQAIADQLTAWAGRQETKS